MRDMKQRHQNAGVETAAQAAMDSQKNIYYEFSKFQPFCANVM